MSNRTVLDIIQKIQDVPLNKIIVTREFLYQEPAITGTVPILTCFQMNWLSSNDESIEARVYCDGQFISRVFIKKTNPAANTPVSMTIDGRLFTSNITRECIDKWLELASTVEIKDDYKSFI